MKLPTKTQQPPAREKAYLLGGTLGILVLVMLVGYGTTQLQVNRPSPANPSPAGTPPVQQGDMTNAAAPPMPQDGQADPAAPPGMPPASADPALQQFQAQAEANPQDAPGLAKLGNAYFDRKNYPKAIDTYYRVIQLDPRNANVLTDLATACFYSGMPHLAVDYYQRAIQSQPDHVNALFNLGIVHLSLKQPDQARQHWLKAKELAKGNPQLHEQITSHLRTLENKI